MALVAGVEIGGGGKLTGVTVGMTIGAAVELDLIPGVLALRDVALDAFQPRVTALQRVSRRSVVFHGEKGGLPALYVMAGSALAAVLTLGELPVMSVLVAIRALLERDGLLEISVGMALCAIDGSVLALKRELRLGVVEALVDGLEADLLPSGCAMAGLAGLREAAVMRVLVAIRAQAEGNAGVLWLAVGTVDVALGALHLSVQAGKGIAGLGVIELAHVDGFPVDEVVA